MRKDFDLPLFHPGRQVGDGPGQGPLCFFDAQGVGTDPHAGFVVFEPRFEVGNENIEEVAARLVELAEVSPPGHPAEYADPRISQLCVHVDLSMPVNAELRISNHITEFTFSARLFTVRFKTAPILEMSLSTYEMYVGRSLWAREMVSSSWSGRTRRIFVPLR